MALYHGGENDVASVSYRPISRDTSPISGYPNIRPLRFTDLGAFQEICMARLRSLIEGIGTSQHLAFRDVRKETVDEIDRMRQEGHGWLPQMTILYDGSDEALIVTLMVGVIHELGATEFATMFRGKLTDLGLPRNAIADLGSSRWGDSSRRSKEGDVAFKPRSRNRQGDWPTLVIEVGVSELLAELHADAEFWLTQSGGQTRIVIVLKINKTTQEILIERWETVPRTRPARSTAHYHPNIGLMQSITLQANAPYLGSP